MRKPNTTVEADNVEAEGRLQSFLSQIVAQAANEVPQPKKEKRPRSKSKPKITTPPINSIKRTKRSTPTTATVAPQQPLPSPIAVTLNIAMSTTAPTAEPTGGIIDLSESTDEEDSSSSSTSDDDDDDDEEDDEKEYYGVREHKMRLMYDAFVVKNKVTYESTNHRIKRQAGKAADQIRVALYGSAAKPLNFPENLGKYLRGKIPESILNCVGEKLCTELKSVIIKKEN
jgi:hypothetical protein